jgi:hypothetical protein
MGFAKRMMTVLGVARRLTGATGPVCRVRHAMFPILTIRRDCRPAFSATKALMTNESAPHPQTRLGKPAIRRMERR